MPRLYDRYYGSKNPSKNMVTFKLGRYLRLSKEDTQRGVVTDESNSIANQNALSMEYYKNHEEEFLYEKVYIDDGCTGTDTNRQGFQQMISDIEAGIINCVMVKDLSRLSRNYSEAGQLLDQFFVKKKVRFICLTDPVIDSYKDPESLQSIAVPIYNIFNDLYAKQTSDKVRQVFDYKRRQGYFIGGFAPYGYMLDPDQKGHLIVDHEAAAVVQMIFDLYCEGKSKLGIVKTLNEMGILSPSQYKRSKGINYRSPDESLRVKGLWNVATVNLILHNQMYIGDMVQGRTKVASYKVHSTVYVPKEKWYIVEDTHEPIIAKEQFYHVQDLMLRNTRAAPQRKDLYLFSGFLRCPDCNGSIVRHIYHNHSGKMVDYHCRTYAQKHKGACTRHGIHHKRLEEAVTATIRNQIQLTANIQEIMERVEATTVTKKSKVGTQEMVAAKEREYQKVLNYKRGIIQEKIDGNISESEYRAMLLDYNAQADSIKLEIEHLRRRFEGAENSLAGKQDTLDSLLKYAGFEKLDREMLGALVEMIYVYEGGKIKIVFKCEDHFREILSYLEANGEGITPLKNVSA